jgi:hypothetical protein
MKDPNKTAKLFSNFKIDCESIKVLNLKGLDLFTDNRCLEDLLVDLQSQDILYKLQVFKYKGKLGKNPLEIIFEDQEKG